MNRPARVLARVSAALAGLALAGAQGACVAPPPGSGLADMVAGASDAVVRVLSVRWRAPGDEDEEPGASPPARGRAYAERASASGFFVAGDGLVASSAHGVRGASEIWVATAGGDLWRATLLGVDASLDLAVLRVPARPARVLPLAADDPRPGEWVTAIGAPFGLERSVSAGVISSPPRELPGGTVPMLQTDVALNPGNSGGPLLDACGQVVGMNSMVFSPHGFYSGVSFSVPASQLGGAVEAIQQRGGSAHLDLQVQTLTPALRRAFATPSAGVVVVQLRPGGSAATAGVRVGDVLVAVQGRRVASGDDLRRALAGTRPGDPAALELWREGALREVQARTVLADAVRSAPAAPQAPGSPPERPSRLGLVLARAKGCGGAPLEVVAMLGPSLVAGIEEGDCVAAVNGRGVATPAEFDLALAAATAAGADTVALLVQREGVPFYVSVPAAVHVPAAASGY